MSCINKSISNNGQFLREFLSHALRNFCDRLFEAIFFKNLLRNFLYEFNRQFLWKLLRQLPSRFLGKLFEKFNINFGNSFKISLEFPSNTFFTFFVNFFSKSFEEPYSYFFFISLALSLKTRSEITISKFFQHILREVLQKFLCELLYKIILKSL